MSVPASSADAHWCAQAHAAMAANSGSPRDSLTSAIEPWMDHPPRSSRRSRIPEPRRVKITGGHRRNPRWQPARRNRPPTLPPAATVAALSRSQTVIQPPAARPTPRAGSPNRRVLASSCVPRPGRPRTPNSGFSRRSGRTGPFAAGFGAGCIQAQNTPRG